MIAERIHKLVARHMDDTGKEPTHLFVGREDYRELLDYAKNVIGIESPRRITKAQGMELETRPERKRLAVGTLTEEKV